MLKPLHRRVLADKLIKLDLVTVEAPASRLRGLPQEAEVRETLRVKSPQVLNAADEQAGYLQKKPPAERPAQSLAPQDIE